MFQPGQVLEFTRPVGGVCQIDQGNQAVYLGNSQAKVLDGPSTGWLVWLTVTAPVKAWLLAPLDEAIALVEE